jgi:hypothetical protein
MEDKQIMKELLELVEEIKKGKVYTFCSCCNKFYLNTLTNMGAIHICDNCMKGINIPTF